MTQDSFVRRNAGFAGWGARSKRHPSDGAFFSDEMVPSTKPWMALPSGCIACSRKVRKMLWRLPPIHFGKEEGVERTLLRVACQSEPFLASPWQGNASIRFLWHIGCQNDFDEHFRGTSRISFKICSPRQKLLTSRQKKSIDTRRNRK